MEKAIKKIIKSFKSSLDFNKLEKLDELLFSLLFKKEVYLLEHKPNKDVKVIDSLLARYVTYKDLIYADLVKSNNYDTDFLIAKIYYPPQRLVLLLTHKCQLRCKYCRVSKFSSSMPEDIALGGLDWLFGSKASLLQIQFFGGEPLLEFELLKKSVYYAEKLAREKNKKIVFILTTNGIILTKEKIDFLKGHNFIVEYSIDGEVISQLKARKAKDGKEYYPKMLKNLQFLQKTDIRYYSISVVMPDTVDFMLDNFKYIVGLGFKSLQINYSLGVFWDKTSEKTFFKQTGDIIKYIKQIGGVEFINFTSTRKEPVVLNAELTLDCNGSIYLESGICLEEDFRKMKKNFLVAGLKNAKSINFYRSSSFENFYRLSKVYGAANPQFRKIILNNIILGEKYNRFLNKAAKGD